MDPNRQLLPSQLDGVNWSPFDHASHGPQLAPSDKYTVCISYAIQLAIVTVL